MQGMPGKDPRESTDWPKGETCSFMNDNILLNGQTNMSAPSPASITLGFINSYEIREMIELRNRIVVIWPPRKRQQLLFQSLEDRLVAQYMKDRNDEFARES